MFQDRQEGGQELAIALEAYKEQPNTIILGLPRGGVVTAFEVARVLKLPLDVICPRKIGAPYNPEYAIGAITETGEGVFNEEQIKALAISDKYLDETIAAEKKEALHRIHIFRAGRKPLELGGKTVIIVDDGMATGLTMKAAILSLRKSHVKKIVVAIPVAPPETLCEVELLADQLICLEAPTDFYAVGQFYREFGQTSTEEVVNLLKTNK